MTRGGAELLNVNQSPEELEQVHGAADYYAYLRSPEFVEAFTRPVADIVNRLGKPVLDAGCGDGALAEHVSVAYAGFDGSAAAVARLQARHATPDGGCGVLAWVGRLEEPRPAGAFPTVVFSGILEVLVRPEARVPLLELYRRTYRAEHFVICDLERLDTSAIEARYGPPLEETHRVAANPGGLPDVKLRRKILLYAAGGGA